MASPFQHKNPYLITEACVELGFPAPYKNEQQLCYVRRILRSGYMINTRQANYIGIHNLHSISSKLRTQRLEFESKRKHARDPRTGEAPKTTVIHLWMTQEQREKANGADPKTRAV